MSGSPDGRRAVEPAGIVLAGGRSRRMGCDKALLELDGRTLIARVVERLDAVCARVILVGPTDAHAFLGRPVVADRRHGQGPLGGLYTGLLAARSELVVVVACDMPFLQPDLLRHLLGRAADDPAVDAVVPRVDGRPEPLHAVYRRSILPALKRLLKPGGAPARALLAADDVRVRWIEEGELRALDPELSSLINLNTPEEYLRARRRLERA